MSYCKICNKELVSSDCYWNSSRTISYCKDHYDERYFLCPIDRKWHLKKLGEMSDNGVMVFGKFIREYTSYYSGTKFKHYAPREVWYFEESGLRMKGFIRDSELNEAVEDLNGYLILKKDAILEEQGKYIHSFYAPQCTYVDGYTKEKFISVDPKNVRLNGSNITVSRNTLKLLIENGMVKNCSVCGKTANGKFNETLREFSHIIPEISKCANSRDLCRDYGIGKDGAPIILCQHCVKCLFPLRFDGVHEIGGMGRGIGIEVECEPFTRSQVMLHQWVDDRKRHLVHASVDHSLRGPFPCEYKSPILHESNYEWWVDEFCSRLKGRVYNRCGLHIHIDTKDLAWWGISNLMQYCHKFEDWFMSIVSPSRILGQGGNLAGLPIRLPWEFSVPFKNKEQMMMALYGKENLSKAESENRRANDQDGPRYDGCIHRYQWLNVHGHFHKGAVEIRLHQGTMSPLKIKNWIALWLSVIEHASKNPKEWKIPMEAIPKYLVEFYSSRSIEFMKHREKLMGMI